ncbi:zinc finger protein Dzip1-like isoform X2 [Scleropages formosus]|uniref:zinc finger protein Dzip1-like isoform X2 n=1 Tax=Scleropages formosus TaxID=113540 RepID=UPI000878634E|nr:zinc finger protein Dzip1-like isoform X2 [Scleropages formosus]
MPFYNNVYYPLLSESQGTHSWARTPSVLNSPQSQSSSSRPCKASEMMGAPSIPVFKFRPRRESVDWRRISAIDVERVANELDVNTLQEHIMGITFCSVEHERCPHCQNPVDPVLLKLFRLAQLTVEYLLHSQDYLTLSLQGAEEKVQASAQEREQLQRQLQKQTDEIKGMKEELKQRKKIIASQQSMINAGLGNFHKCQHCDKAFLNSSFLQSHMQRRHPEEYDMRLPSEIQKNIQSIKLEEEISKLKEQLMLTRSQLETQQQAYVGRVIQEQDQKSKDGDLLKVLEQWKEEEKERQKKQMEEMKQIFLKESKEMSRENAYLQNQLSEVEEASRKMRLNIKALQDEKVELSRSAEERHREDILKLQQQLKKQDEKWASRMQRVQAMHEHEKNQFLYDLDRVRSTANSEEEKNRKRMEELDWKLQEQKELIISQRNQMKKLTSNPVQVVVERTDVALVPEPKLKAPRNDSASISEKKEVKNKPPISALRKNPNIKKELRPFLEQALLEKLEAFGIKPGASRLSHKEFNKIRAKVSSERTKREKQFPECQRVREKLLQTLGLKVKEKRADSSSTPEQHSRSKQLYRETHVRSRSSSFPSGVTQVVSRPLFNQQQTPQPAPRSKTYTVPKTSTPSFQEDSEDDAPVQKARSVVKSVIGPSDSDTEETDGSVMEEINPQQLQFYKQPTQKEEKVPQSGVVKDLTKDLERQVADRSMKKPAGSVDVLSDKNNVLQNLKCSEKDDGDNDDDWDISSLEDNPVVTKPVQSSFPVKKSLDSTSTSVWESSTGKVQKGFHETEAPSTLKSSLLTLSDWSDCEDDI